MAENSSASEREVYKVDGENVDITDFSGSEKSTFLAMYPDATRVSGPEEEIEQVEAQELNEDLTPGKNVGSDVNATEEPFSGVLKSEEVSSDSPIIPSQDFLPEEEIIDFKLGKDEKVYKKEQKEEEKLNNFINVPNQRQGYNSMTGEFETEASETVFSKPQGEGVDALKELYRDSDLTFESKVEYIGKGSRIISTASLNGKTIDLKFGNKETQEKSKKALDKLIRDNKKSINFAAWNKNKDKQLKKRKVVDSNNQLVKDAIVKNTKDIKDNKDLFTPYEETKKTRSYSGGSMMAPGIDFGGNGDNTVTKTIYPYEKEIKIASDAIIKANTKANYKLSSEDVRKLAEKQVRAQLYGRAIIDAKSKFNQMLIENGDISKEEMYASNIFLENKNAKDWNQNSTKLIIAGDTMESSKALQSSLEKSIMGQDDLLLEERGTDQIKAAAELGITYKQDPTIIELQNGKKITKGFYDMYRAVHSQANASKSNVNNLMDSQRKIAEDMEDIKLSMTASAKNYSLIDKYSANIGLGITDIIAGGIRSAAEGSSQQQPLYKELISLIGGEYSKFSQEKRQSFVSDVSFEDKFSSGTNFGKFLLQEASTQLPFFAAIALSGGSAAPALIGITSAGKKLNDMNYEMSQGGERYSQGQQYLKALGYGLLDAADVAIGKVPLLKGAKSRWISAGQKGAIDTSAKAWLKTQSPGFVSEILLSTASEMANTGGQNLIDGRDFKEGMDHAGFSAFGFSLLFSGTPYFRGLYNASLSNYNSLGDIRKSQKKLDELSLRYNTAQTDGGRDIYAKAIEAETKVRDGLIKSNETLINNTITEGGADAITKITAKQSQLQNQAKEIIADESLTDTQKQQQLAYVNSEFKSLANAKEDALSKGALSKNEVEFKAFKAIDKQAYDEYMESANQQLIGESDGKNPTKEDIDRRAYNLFFGDKARIENNKNKSNKETFDGGFKSFETKAEAVDYINKQENLTPELKQQAIEGIENGNDGVAVQNLDPSKPKVTLAVVENQVLNQRKYIRTHEVGHQALWGILKNIKNESGLESISNQLLLSLKNQFPKAHKRILDSAGVRKEDGSLDSDEVIARFLEEVAGDRVGPKIKAKGIAGLFGVMVQKQFASDYKFDFKGEEDIFNFVVGLGKKISDGTLTLKDIKAAQEGVIVKDLVSKQGDAISDIDSKVADSKANKQLTPEQDASISIEVNDLQAIKKENQELAAKYGKEPIKGGKETRLENKILESIDPIIGRIVTDRTKALYDPIAVDAKKSVSRQDFQESMRSDIQTMVIEEFNGKQDLEKFIVNRSFLRANNLAKRLGIQSVEQGITKGIEAAEKIAVDETKTAEKDIKLTKATKILSEQQLNEAKDIIAKAEIKDKDLSYKKLKGLTAKVVSEVTGIPEGKIGFKNKNLSQGQTTTAAMFISNNIEYIRNTLPEGAVLEGASKDLIETSTGVPDKMLKAFYVKSKRGKNLSAYILRKSLTSNEILEEIGRPRGSKPVPINPRTPRGSVIKGIIDIVNRNITNELVRTEKDLTPQQRVDTGAGRGKNMFSETALKNINILLAEQNFLATDNDFSVNAKIWKKIVEATGQTPINMNTLKGRKLFLDTAISSGLVSKTPESLWRNLQGTTKSIKNQAGETIGRDYASSLPFLNVSEAKIWIAGVKESGVKFAPETKVYEDMFKKVNPKAKKKPLEVLLKDPKFIKSQENSIQGLKDIFLALENVMKNKKNVPMVVALLASTSGYQGAFIRRAAPWKAYQKGYKTNLITQEHTLPASLIAKYLFGEALNGRVNESFKNVEKNYFQVALLNVDDKKLKGTTKAGVKFNYTEKTPEGWVMSDSIWARYFNINVGNNNGGIDPATMMLANGNSIQQEFMINEMGFEVSKEYIKNKIKASESNNSELAKIIKYSKPITVQESINALAKSDKALDIARDLNAPVKKIRVFDFDDTLARTKSKIGYTMPDGTTGKIDAETFAKNAGIMEAEGATWDFSEFSKVMDGKKGPLFEVAKKIQEVRGSEDIFVLTARPADAAGPIKEFLGSLGLDIPLNNITGLGDGSPQAKAGWIVGKAANGYNDFYFTDDAIGNVKAVKDALSVLDVKSKVQQAKIKFSENIDIEFNKIIENSTGIAAEKNYAKVKARLVGKDRGKFDLFIPPSAEDFAGLLYKTLGKGKIGDSQMTWYKDNLLNPYARAIESITRDRNTLGRNFKALKKELNVVPKDLKKKFPGSEFTKEQGVRVYIWDQIGKDIPGLSKADLKELTDIVKNDPELEIFAQEVMKLNKGTEYVTPKDTWVTGTITTDLLETLNTTKRKQYLEQWQQNADIIFSEKNLNKMEAAYGRPYRDAMENILARMKTGTNRTFGGDTLTGRVTDWLNGSTAAIMFFNTRSAVLQTLSAVNFINFKENNIFAAGKAFANQPQYWSDFKKLFNSDFLTERRDGLKINVNEADIANVAKENGVRGVINKLLKLGFLPTQIADSFAIASGGATFYRNRLQSLIKEGMNPLAAEKQAMRDFREIAEESQQSSRPDKISAQQAGPLGRIVLAFANTPAQYARLIKKAASDLKNGRGDAKTNISKIMYYGVAQNLLFNALQQALFALSFDDEDEVDKKTIGIANGMADSLLRGMGIGGAVFSVVKNTAMKLYEQSEKKNPKYENAALELLKISPPISSKIGKVRSVGRTMSWNMDEMKNTGFSLDNPAYLALGNTVSAATNIPLDRVIKKIQHLKSASDAELETYKRMALVAGWGEWELGIKKESSSNTRARGRTNSRTRTRSRTRRRRN